MTDSTGLARALEQERNRKGQPPQFGSRTKDWASWMQALYRDLDRQLNALDRSRVACTAGCASCCVVNVAVLMPEAIALVEYLRKTLPPGRSVELTERIGEHFREVRGLSEQERLSLQASCAFLDAQGTCQVYPLRPLMCRSVSSVDAARCRAALTATDPSSAPPVLMHLQQKQLFDAAFIELAQTLADQGLDDRSTTLTTAVYRLLVQPELAAAWMEGGEVPSG